ncbi:phage antirepressor KilAC domain-containing protein [Aerococcaceae bacterium zg-ZUI334]|uniref:phage antirepressor n=1 Tax=Aerococcaceae bacterium zg-252 TaxID=2796928 RepID=UPI001B959398|nr:phage antirepressor KilAC domain-containing protein [Aerococcaceae bacterium zg-ZUI334]
MTNIQIFSNDAFGTIRTVMVDGHPRFIGKDVAEILEYRNGSRDINRHVDEEDRFKMMISDGNQLKETIVINESGLYSLILSSHMPKAKAFKRWVTSEVLPAIRKTGMYATDYLLGNPDIAIAAFTALKEERERNKTLTHTIAIQNQQISEMKPKASYYDVILSSTNVISMSVLSKDYGKSAQWMNNTLHKLGVQYKQGKTWLLYQKYASMGYTDTKTHHYSRGDGSQGSSVHTYWTQKGRLFIYDLLKANHILPLIEQEEEHGKIN